MQLAMVVGLVAAVAASLGSSHGGLAAPAADPIRIEVLSSRADLVTGTDALVAVQAPPATNPGMLRVDLNGRDVTGAFGQRPDGRFEGLVQGLAVGANTLMATLPDGRGAQIVITDHPIGGPLISGPQLQPWACHTTDSGLGAATDSQCDTPTTYRYYFKNAFSGQFDAYDPANPPPAAEIATTTTDRGVTVPYIVRDERGALDRTVYDITVLDDPQKLWAPWAAQPAWNHKFYYEFGGGCANKYWQTANSAMALDDVPLSHGFAVATTGLNVLANNCNEVLSAEAVMMVKERVQKFYGPIRYTMSTGCSGGSLQQYAIAATYPGLLDGIQPSCTFLDITETENEVFDCVVLLHYFDVVSPQLWGVEKQRSAVTGHLSSSSCEGHEALGLARTEGDPKACGGTAGVYTNYTGVVGESEPAWAYDPATNPRGARCDIWDFTANVWGRRVQDGFANRPWNNIGIQYGLGALQSGLITADQFVDLNQKAGGLDSDFKFQAGRSSPDPGSVATAYRSGRVADPRQLAKVAIIDAGGLDDVEIHTTVRAWSYKARLAEANGTSANQAIMRMISAADSFRLLDQWLSNVESDSSSDSVQLKLVRDKPSAVVDSCYVGTQQITDWATCETNGSFNHYANPRMVAGEALADDIMQCQLRPLARADYPVSFTDAQWAALQQAFPIGVCNWHVRGVDQQPALTWLTYASGPGGAPLGTARQSTFIQAAASSAGPGAPANTGPTLAGPGALPNTGPTLGGLGSYAPLSLGLIAWLLNRRRRRILRRPFPRGVGGGR